MQKIITSSWDDGYIADIRLAKLLCSYNIPSTFYIPQKNSQNNILHDDEIKALSKDFDIGGHTLNHVNLQHANEVVMRDEIYGCKKWLEKLVEREIDAFCYPGGRYTEEAIKIVKMAGFKFARTVHLLQTEIKDIYLSPTTVQCFNHSRVNVIKNLVKRKSFCSLNNFILKMKTKTDCEFLAECCLEEIEEKGGVFHLWGHSWELEHYDLWKQLEIILKKISNKSGFVYMNNSELANNYTL